MKHIHTFESFLNEGKEDRTMMIQAGTEMETVEVLKKAGITVTLSQPPQYGGDFEIEFRTPQHAEKGEKILADHFGTNESKTNEAQGLDYWKDYEVDTSPQANMHKWMADKCTTMPTVLKCIDKAIDAWNKEAEADGGDRVTKASERYIGDLAIQFYKKFGYINGNIISAMIMQES